MKAYILRDPKAVEPQNRNRPPLPYPLQSEPGVTATVDVSCGPATPVPPAGRSGSAPLRVPPPPVPPPKCPRCQKAMRLVGAWSAGQRMLFPNRPP